MPDRPPLTKARLQEISWDNKGKPELKDAKGKQGDAQIRFQRQWEACGHEYVLVRSLEEFVAVVKRYVDN